MALELMREMRGTVIELGESCYPGVPPRCTVGENVLISKFCGVLVKGPLDGEMYRLCNDEDIFCGLQGNMAEMMIEDPVAKSKRDGGEGRTKARILSERS